MLVALSINNTNATNAHAQNSLGTQEGTQATLRKMFIWKNGLVCKGLKDIAYMVVSIDMFDPIT